MEPGRNCPDRNIFFGQKVKKSVRHRRTDLICRTLSYARRSTFSDEENIPDPFRWRKDVSQDPQMLQQDLEAQQDKDHASRKLRL